MKQQKFKISTPSVLSGMDRYVFVKKRKYRSRTPTKEQML